MILVLVIMTTFKVAAASLPPEEPKEKKTGKIAPTLDISGYVGLVRICLNITTMVLLLTKMLKIATSVRASAIAFLILFHSSSHYPGSLSSSHICEHIIDTTCPTTCSLLSWIPIIFKFSDIFKHGFGLSKKS